MLLILVSLCGLNSCVSQHKHLLVHLSCHSITKTKQGLSARRSGQLRPHKPVFWLTSHISCTTSYKGKVCSQFASKDVTFQFQSTHSVCANPRVVPTPVSELSWPVCGSDGDPLTARGGSGSLGTCFGEEVLVPGGGSEPCAAA